jgi:hypothetical protein
MEEQDPLGTDVRGCQDCGVQYEYGNDQIVLTRGVERRIVVETEIATDPPN